MPYGEKFLIRRSVRIIPAHKKHRQQAGVLLARRSTPANRNLSAARLSDILPGSYLLAEQSPGSSQLQTPPGVQHPSRAYPHIIKEKSPCVKGIFLFCSQNFSSVFVPFADGSASRKPLPCRTGAHAAATLLASACRDTIPAYSPCPQTAAHCCCRRSRTGTVCLTPSSRWAVSPSWHCQRPRSPYTPRPPHRPRRSSPAPPA